MDQKRNLLKSLFGHLQAECEGVSAAWIHIIKRYEKKAFQRCSVDVTSHPVADVLSIVAKHIFWFPFFVFTGFVLRLVLLLH